MRLLIYCTLLGAFLSVFPIKPVFAQIDLSELPIKQAQSLEKNLQIIESYFKDIKKATKNITKRKDSNSESIVENKDLVEGDRATTPSPVSMPDNNRVNERPYIARQSQRRRDPFAITPRMFEADQSLQDLGLDFKPDTELKIPDLKLKGVVNGVDGKIAALVDVEDVGVIVVREGDTIGVRSKDGGGLRVRKISRTGLILTAGSLGRDVIVK